MEKAEAEIDSMDSHPAITLSTVTSYCHVIEGHMLELFECPGREHDPGHDGVDQEDQSIGNPRSHTVQSQLRVKGVGKHRNYLLCNFPHALQSAEHVAAPQQEAPNETS